MGPGVGMGGGGGCLDLRDDAVVAGPAGPGRVGPVGLGAASAVSVPTGRGGSSASESSLPCRPRQCRAGRQPRFVPPLHAPWQAIGPRVGGARSGILTRDSANPESANPEPAKEDIDSGFCELASATANKQ